MKQPLWITEAEVVRLLDLGDAIDALERGLLMEARGETLNMVKTHVLWGKGNTLHAIGAVFSAAGLVGTKTWAHTEGGACPLLVLFDATTGALKAIIEAFVLGQMRTGGISGVATDWLARPDADELAIIGTGKQALAQVAAVAAVRQLKRVRVYSPHEASRKQFIDRLRSELEVEAIEADSVERAVNGAPIVTLVTCAREPFLYAAMLARGCHVNAVGAITPEREEFAQDVFVRCDRVAVDSVEAVKKLSKEFITRYAGEDDGWRQVIPLSQLLARGEKRRAGADLTLFKAMGMGVSDLALGTEIYERALQQGAGREFPQPQRARPRFTPGKIRAPV